MNLYHTYGKFNQHFVDRIVSLNALNRLRLYSYESFDCVTLSGLLHLKDISFPGSIYITDIESVANTLKNLKFIHFGISHMDHAKLFMSGNEKLERLQIDWFIDEDGNIEDEKVINLIELNKERAQLPIAKKVTFFVKEPIYLATKRAMRNTDLDFIELKRTDSLHDREFDFYYPRVYLRKPCLIRS